MARRRTLVHVEGLAMVNWDVHQLAVNAYLQGVRDAFETMIKRPELFRTDTPEPDY